MLIRPLDRQALREQFRTAEPFPFIAIDDFLEPGFAAELAAAYPGFEAAADHGHRFDAVNERNKIQISEASRFPDPVDRLHRALAAPGLLADLSAITGISSLLADPALAGGGMHLTGPQGRLDVHVDFNVVEDRGWHRRLNILVYLNPDWQDAWGGNVELWDAKVRSCHHSFAPRFNRCVLFQTSEISFHGVSAVSCPPGVARQSFAAYYYTAEAPEGWDGRAHSTIFRARPDERLRGYLLMPAERVGRRMRHGLRRAGRGVRKLLGGARG